MQQQVKYKVISDVNKQEERRNKRKKQVIIEIMKRTKKLVKSLKIQLKKWMQQQVKFKVILDVKRPGKKLKNQKNNQNQNMTEAKKRKMKQEKNSYTLLKKWTKRLVKYKDILERDKKERSLNLRKRSCLKLVKMIHNLLCKVNINDLDLYILNVHFYIFQKLQNFIF